MNPPPRNLIVDGRKTLTRGNVMAQESPSRMFMIQAKEMFDAGQFSAAIMTLREGLRHYPHFISARVLLGEVYWTSGEVELARTELEQVVKAVPDNFAAHRKLALIYRESGEFEAASRSCRAVLQANPRDLEMRALLDQLKPKVSQPREAKSSATELGSKPAASAPGHIHAKRMDTRSDKIDPAAIDTETLAELYIVQGHREEGLSVYRRLADKEPGNVRYRERIASLEHLPGSLASKRTAPEESPVPTSLGAEDAGNPRRNQVRRLEGWLQIIRDRRRS
jgi:tetratricopeptide (TPR) repeat protein